MDELRRKGLEKMNEVYGWEMPDMPGEYFAVTVDHLFGTIWTRPGLSMRDRRADPEGFARAMGESYARFGFAVVRDHGLDAGVIERAPTELK